MYIYIYSYSILQYLILYWQFRIRYVVGFLGKPPILLLTPIFCRPPLVIKRGNGDLVS